MKQPNHVTCSCGTALQIFFTEKHFLDSILKDALIL